MNTDLTDSKGFLYHFGIVFYSNSCIMNYLSVFICEICVLEIFIIPIKIYLNLTIRLKDSASRLAPPTSAPSISGICMS
jgi:hypothetical protein